MCMWDGRVPSSHCVRQRLEHPAATSEHSNGCMSVYVYVYVCMCVCVYMCRCACVYVCMCMCV